MKYICSVCGYIYDCAKEKTAFAQLPDSWKCPLCGAPKSAFGPEKTEPAKPEAIAPQIDEDMLKLSAGQMSALFSNLARGCEKQYKAEEAELFREIAQYYAAAVPETNDPSLEALSALLTADIQTNYPATQAAAQAEKDRGAQRVCVWGEKVTRMLSALVERYRSEGESMLRNTQVWVCTVCGFTYIGKTPPQLCPVCKVPDWKFEKIGGRDAQ